MSHTDALTPEQQRSPGEELFGVYSWTRLLYFIATIAKSSELKSLIANVPSREKVKWDYWFNLTIYFMNQMAVFIIIIIIIWDRNMAKC